MREKRVEKPEKYNNPLQNREKRGISFSEKAVFFTRNGKKNLKIDKKSLKTENDFGITGFKDNRFLKRGSYERRKETRKIDCQRH